MRFRGRSKTWSHRLDRRPTPRPATRRADSPDRSKAGDTGRFTSGYRLFRDGTYREDFGSDR